MSMSDSWLSDEEADAALIRLMEPDDQGPYGNYGHRFLDSAFVGRSFAIYRAGKTKTDAELLAVFDVTDLGFDEDGLFVRLRNRYTKTDIDVGHVPTRLGRYAVFAQVPAKNMMRRTARRGGTGEIEWTTDIGFMLKVRNSPDFHNAGNIYAANIGDFVAKFGPLDKEPE